MKARGMSLKRVLKRSLTDVLPPEILKRRKKGFGVPLDRWLRTDLRTYVQSRLGAPDASVRRHVDGATLDGILDEHLSGRGNRGHALWTLLTLEVFLRREGW
jgi:asparagine synthase (glutamine-hydrolysing)